MIIPSTSLWHATQIKRQASHKVEWHCGFGSESVLDCIPHFFCFLVSQNVYPFSDQKMCTEFVHKCCTAFTLYKKVKEPYNINFNQLHHYISKVLFMVTTLNLCLYYQIGLFSTETCYRTMIWIIPSMQWKCQHQLNWTIEFILVYKRLKSTVCLVSPPPKLPLMI